MARPSPTRLLALTAALILVAELFANDAAPVASLALTAWGTAVTAVLLLVALPRVDPAAHGVLAVSFAITALFTCVAFWSALPFAFGAGAIAAARQPFAAPALAGVVAMVVAMAFCIIA